MGARAGYRGFTLGIAVIIATSQLRDLFGLTVETPGGVIAGLAALWEARSDLSLPAFTIGLATMVLITLFRRAAPRFPGLIVAVALTSAAVALLALSVDTITTRFGTLPNTLPQPTLPAAIVIAFLAGIESLLSAIVADRMIGGQHRSNAELIAQGATNLGSALFGGLPATGAIARTATNVRAGGRTPVAGLIHAATILLAMTLVAPLVGYLAMPALSGLLILTAWNMSEPHKWRGHLAAPRTDKALMALTFVLTIATDLTVAISVGVGVGLALRLARRGTPPDWTPPDR